MTIIRYDSHPDVKLQQLIKIHPDVLQVPSLDGIILFKRENSSSPFVSSFQSTPFHAFHTINKYIQAFCVGWNIDGEIMPLFVTDEFKVNLVKEKEEWSKTQNASLVDTVEPEQPPETVTSLASLHDDDNDDEKDNAKKQQIYQQQQRILRNKQHQEIVLKHSEESQKMFWYVGIGIVVLLITVGVWYKMKK